MSNHPPAGPLADSITSLMLDWEQPLEDRYIATGFEELDRRYGGVVPGELTVLASRPGMGKTSMALNMARNVSMAGSTVLYCSSEDSERVLLRSVLASTGRVDVSRMGPNAAQAHWKKAIEASGRLYGLPLHILASRQLTVDDIETKLDMLDAAGQTPDLVVIDTMQSMSDTAPIPGRLARLAADRSLALLVLSHLPWEIEERETPRGRLMDLGCFDGLDRAADKVLFLLRRNYYDPDVDPGMAELHVAKHKNGPVGFLDLAFLEEFRLFASVGF